MQQSEKNAELQNQSINTAVETIATSDTQSIAANERTGDATAANWSVLWLLVPTAIVLAWLLWRPARRNNDQNSSANDKLPARSNQRTENDQQQANSGEVDESEAKEKAARRREKASQAVAESKKLVKLRIKEKKKLQKLTRAQSLERARNTTEPSQVPNDSQIIAEALANPQAEDGQLKPKEHAQVTQPSGWHATAAVQAAMRESQPTRKKTTRSQKSPANSAAAGFQKYTRHSTAIRQVADPANVSDNKSAPVAGPAANPSGIQASGTNEYLGANESPSSTSAPRTLKDFIGSRNSSES